MYVKLILSAAEFVSGIRVRNAFDFLARLRACGRRSFSSVGQVLFDDLVSLIALVGFHKAWKPRDQFLCRGTARHVRFSLRERGRSASKVGVPFQHQSLSPERRDLSLPSAPPTPRDARTRAPSRRRKFSSSCQPHLPPSGLSRNGRHLAPS